MKEVSLSYVDGLSFDNKECAFIEDLVYYQKQKGITGEETQEVYRKIYRKD